MTLSLRERVILVKYYYMHHGKALDALRAYRRDYGTKTAAGPCSVKAIHALVAKFEANGSVLDAPRSGRPSTVTSCTEMVRSTLDTVSSETPHGESSLRGVSRLTGLPFSNVRNVARNILRLHPYKFNWVQELKAGDHAKRFEFANECMKHMGVQDNTWLQSIFWTDEAHFHLHGGVNSHNCVIWADSAPARTVEKSLHDDYVSVWCGFSADFILGPYFFEEPTLQGFKRVTITGARYLKMLSEFVVPNLADRGVLEDTIFQHDGSPVHINGPVLGFLRKTFGSNMISRCSDFEWPPRSPDLTPADFWLWGCLKSRVYRRAPTNIVELKNAISEEISHITPDQLCSAVASFGTRITAVLQGHGGHIEN
jgi:Helix-turn-helix domain (DUF4817)